MKHQEALDIINNSGKSKGFMISFDRIRGIMIEGHHFPDKHAGEELIETEGEAWELARKFADATFRECINIRVIDHKFRPLKTGFCEVIRNR
jgi:hypothetical protein